MASTVSVSKGVFLYKNGMKAASKTARQHKKQSTIEPLSDDLWYQTYKNLWGSIESDLEAVYSGMFTTVLNNLVSYVRDCYQSRVTEIPSAALLTGINMPDHRSQFEILSGVVKMLITPHIVTLTSENCSSLKQLVENLCFQLISNSKNRDELDDDDEDSVNLKKSQCSFALLQTWYEELYSNDNKANSPKKKQKIKDNRKIIVVIVTDFESFNERVIQDFILISSSYMNTLPFVFVFGVATSITILNQSLPYQVSSKIKIRVFQSPPSTICLNSVIENVLFSSKCPFYLGGKVFNLFTDIFLFYDLSVYGFIRNFKYAMLEHFSYGNAMALCNQKRTDTILQKFQHDDYENIRRLLSFRRFVEIQTAENRIKLLRDDGYLRECLLKEIRKIQKYIKALPVFMRCLLILVGDLPKTPLGKQVRELYSFIVTEDLMQNDQYQECFKLLKFQSKHELYSKIKQIIDILTNNQQLESKTIAIIFDNIVEKLQDFLQQLDNIKGEINEDSGNVDGLLTGQMSRLQLKNALLANSKQSKQLNDYEKIRLAILDYLNELFRNYLRQPETFHFHEIYFFNDISIRNHIIGIHRTAIHTALNDPHQYLQCSCCYIDNDSMILPTMPDISIVYKLHLECGKMINLYDWLQAYLSIVDPSDIDSDDCDDKRKKAVDPKLQARFTQAVAELEYLGFIKSSRRKTDHVTRLTWGG